MKHWTTVSLLLLLFPMLAYSQGVTTSTLRGVVTDESGETLPGANVVAVHQPSGSQYGTTTNESGRYTLANLRVGGPYVITASFVGYQTVREEGLQLRLGDSRSINFELVQRTEQLDEVEVIAEQGGNVERAGLQQEISEREIELQPTVGNTLADFTRLTPNAVVLNDDDDGPAISIAGQNNRYNSIFIDGAVSNDVFGLSAQGTNGGQTGATPISTEVIEQFKIDVSPFDVTQSGFAGGAINIVTRSGTNELKGALYYDIRDEALAGRTPTADPEVERELLPNFSNERYGLRLGGPIIKDKAFFFVSGELLRSSTPQPSQPFASDLTGLAGQLPGADGVGSNTEFLSSFRTYLEDRTGYDPGAFGDQLAALDSDKLFAKIDWNISDNQKITARYSYTQSDNIDAFASDNNDISFGNNSEVFPNTQHQPVLEWTSSYSNRFANKLILTYTSNVDDRGFQGSPFPDTQVAVDTDGDGNVDGDLNFGSEPFSTVNLLEQDIYTITNNFNWFVGPHTLTFGVHGEYYSILNKFIPQNFGSYEYNSFEDFIQSVEAFANPNLTPAEPDDFVRSYSLVDDRAGDATSAAADFSAFQVGFYVQDEWQFSDRLRLTGGLRVDVPSILDDPETDPFITNETIPAVQEFYDLDDARPGQSPSAQFAFQPRAGFNFDVFGDNSTQIRGGAGVFLSRVPFVWPGGSFTNNGLTVGRVDGTELEDGSPVPFVANPVEAEPSGNGIRAEDFGLSAIPSGRLEFFDEGFNYPTVFRTSLGVDQQLPYGIVGTLEGQYTNTLQNINVINVNLRNDNIVMTDGPVQYPVLATAIEENGVQVDQQANLIDPAFPEIYRVTNTSKGYAFDITARLRKGFEDVQVGSFQVADAITLDASYTYNDAFAVNDGTSSQISSLYRFNETTGLLNDLDVTRSDFSIGHRVLSSVKVERGGTTVSLLFTGVSGRPFSYVIDNSDDLRGDNGGDGTLFFVPENASDYTFGEFSDGELTIFPADQQAELAAQLDAFIDGNDYLSERRGEFTGRNGDRAPFETVIDFHLEQQIFGDLGAPGRNILVTFDVFNLTNLINSDWGRRYDFTSALNVMEFEGFRDAAGGDFTPVYSLEANVTNNESLDDLLEGEFDDSGLYTARWQARLGIRLVF